MSNNGTPFINDVDFQLYVGDVREVLAQLPAESVDCCVTSPPYWGLRDYGHDGQIGLEATPELFVAEMVAVFREVRRMLAPHGTLWLNLGDSYAGSWGAQSRPDGNDAKSTIAGGSMLSARQIEAHPKGQTHTGSLKNTPGLKQKDLCGIPWRVAFALQQDGWYLRADIIWSKPNPMPESVTDRPTKAHEYVFLLSKQPRYFFDQEAVREPAEWARWGDQTNAKHEGSGSAAGWIGAKPKGDLTQRRTAHYNTAERYGAGNGGNSGFDKLAKKMRDGEHGGRNVRSVWEIATQPYPDAHFATFPEALPERCIKAGCPAIVCPKHGPIVGGPQACTECELSPRSGIVLDPFMGSGTTALVARRLGRKSIGVELNAEYAELAARRLQQLSLLADAA